MPKSLSSKINHAQIVHHRLQEKYPNVTTFLTHKTPFQLLIAVILSAQCTDVRINKVTPKLFQSFPNAKEMATAELPDITDHIKSVTYFNSKAKNIQKTAIYLQNTYNGQVPQSLDELIQCPGVGRKTANVVLGQAFGIPGITVDTHVNRVSQRLGFTTFKDALRIEKDLMEIWPKITWIDLSSTMILHGRDTCKARKPQCLNCLLNDICPYPK